MADESILKRGWSNPDPERDTTHNVYRKSRKKLRKLRLNQEYRTGEAPAPQTQPRVAKPSPEGARIVPKKFKVKKPRVLTYNQEKAKAEFRELVKALDEVQPLVYQEREFEQVSIRVPKFYKDELRVDKARYGIPMSAQVRAFAMQRRRGK